MQLPQTSLIPVTVAISRYVESYGLNAFDMWFKAWYLGTPFKYIADPLVPLAINLVHNLMPNVTLINSTIYLIVFAYFISLLGWALFVFTVTKNKALSFITFLFLIILPWRLFATFSLLEGSFAIAKSIISFSFIFLWLSLVKRKPAFSVLAIISLTTLLLTNTYIVPTLLVGLISLAFSYSFKNKKFVDTFIYLRKLLLFFIASFVIVTFWYTPGYWFTLLSNPSIGGNLITFVAFGIFGLARVVLPVAFAIFAVSYAKRVGDRLTAFALIWTGSFTLLTLYRFFADYDFWQDWTAWIYEIEIGLAIICAIIASRIIASLQKRKLNESVKATFLLVIILISPYMLVARINVGLGHGKDSLESRITRFEKYIEIIPQSEGVKRIFVSGSNTFGLNMYSEIEQVRGGRDAAARHPYWNHATYQILEGNDHELTKAWLRALGVTNAIVNTGWSSDYYHDFKNLAKWEKMGKLIGEVEGDKIYFIEKASLAWTLNSDKITIKPKGGDDIDALNEYLKLEEKPIEVKDRVGGYSIRVPAGERFIRLAVSYDPRWEASMDSRIKKDALGQMLIVINNPPSESTEIVLNYR